MDPLTIHSRRERLLVRAADALLAPYGVLRGRRTPAAPASILCLRLERIGDLLMTLPAIAELRALAPAAVIDLAVGSWNADLARAIPGLRDIESVDASWLARGARGASLARLISRAIRWRSRRYDLVINFEPDIRSNLLAAVSGARVRAGFSSGGGGPLLDISAAFDPRAHTADNGVALVRAIFGRAADPHDAPRLELPATARDAATRLVGGRRAPLVGLHVSAGRAIKQWPEERFADVAGWLARERHATIVLTGAPSDRPHVDRVRAAMPEGSAIDITGADLLTAAAVLERLDLVLAPDTGPMHLAHAVGTPVVAVFGPSDPARYAPRGARDRVVRIDLPCAPCNRIRMPPERCVGHTPDCLEGITVAMVRAAIDDVLGAAARSHGAVPA